MLPAVLIAGRRQGMVPRSHQRMLQIGATARPRCVREPLARAIDRDGNLIDTMLSPSRDMKAARRFFRSARSVAGFVPDRVTTDGHNSYPRAIRSTLGRDVRHRTSVHLNNRLEQDHRGSKDGSDVCAASRSIMRQRDSAARTTNFAISPAADRRERRSWRRLRRAIVARTVRCEVPVPPQNLIRRGHATIEPRSSG